MSTTLLGVRIEHGRVDRPCRVRALGCLLLCLGGVGFAFSPRATAEMAITSVAEARQNGGSKTGVVRLQGVITGFSGWKNSFFLQDRTGAISVDRLENTEARPGDEVRVTGQLRPGLFAPILLSEQTQVMGYRGLPRAEQTTFDPLASGAFDSRLVEVTGIVDEAHMGEIWGKQILLLHLHSGRGFITVHVLADLHRNFEYLVDSTIRVTGVCGTIFKDRRQLVGLRLFVSGLSHIAMVKPAVETARLVVSPLSSLMKFNGPSLDRRVKVTGTVTYQAAPNIFYLQQGDAAIRIQS